MPWIESHTHIIKNHKILRLSTVLNIPPVQVVGHLHALWHNILELREDGDISAWTPKEIAYYAQYEGDPEKFFNALKDGWIDNNNGYILIHDWLNYAGRYLQGKYRNPETKHKWEKIKTKHEQHSVHTQSAHTGNQPNQPNQPNHTAEVKKQTSEQVFSYFCQKFKETRQKTYIASFGKDKKLFKSLLEQIEEKELRGLIDKFFASKDKFIEQSGYTVGVFASQINKLQSEKCEKEPWLK